MKLCQITTKNNDIVCREVSCFCSRYKNCDCIDAKSVKLLNPPSQNKRSSKSKEPAREQQQDQTTYNQGLSTAGYLGKHVVVRYEKRPYPGIVLDEDGEDVLVRCMHRIGDNRFFWIACKDVCYYMKDDILVVIPEPQNVTGHHKQVDSELWQKISRLV